MSALFLTGLAMSFVCTYFLISGVGSGKIWAAKSAFKVARTDQPVLFWFTAAVYLMMAGVGLLFMIDPFGH